MRSDSQNLPPRQVDDPDADSIAAIRELLASEEETPVAKPWPKHRAKPAPAQEPAADRAEPAVRPQAAPQQSTPETAGLVGRLKASVLGCRPTPRHIALAALALLLLFRPWLVLGLVFLFAFILTGTFLILGYDGFWWRAMRIARWYARRHPSRSMELHRKLDNFAMKFDAFLDRFPEGTVDGLYLPDLGDLAEADKRHGEVLDRRFETLRES